jgi:AAA domain/DnaB-like helicase N terminal domain
VGDVTRPVPPHDVGAEQALIGAAILDATVLERVHVDAPDFYRPAHETLWRAIGKLNGEHPDRARGVLDLLRGAGELERVGGGAYIHTCVEACITEAAAEQYARVVRQHARRRRVIEALTRGLQQVTSAPDDDVDAPGYEAMAGLEAVLGDEQPGILDQLRQLRAALVDTEGLDTIPPPEPLVEGIFDRDSLVWLQGKSGHGKSFLGVDLAGCVGTGHHWHGRAVHQGTVLYIAAEGVSGMRQRVRAWEKSYGRPMLGVRWLPLPVQASNTAEWSALIDLAAEIGPELVIVDTQARVTVGMEENAAKDMGVFVDKLEKLRHATHAAVLVLHHIGRSGDHMRGSTSLEGAADTVLSVAKDDAEITLSNPKQKNAEEFADIHLRLQPFRDSAVLMPSTAGAGGAARRGGAAWKMAEKWWAEVGPDPMSESKLVDAGIATKPTFYRNVKSLVDAGIVHKDTKSRPYTTYALVRDPNGED